MALPLIGAGIGLVGSIGKMIGRGKANREMDRLLGEDPTYSANPLAADRLGLAQNLLNARMPGSAAMERNIFSNQASQLTNINNLATDANQALTLAGGVAANTSDQITDMGVMEAQDYQRRYQNLVGAQDASIAEGDKVFGDQVRRFQNKVQVKAAQNANKQSNWGDVANFGFGLSNLGLSAGQGFGKMFGGGNGVGGGSGGGGSYYGYVPTEGYFTP